MRAMRVHRMLVLAGLIFATRAMASSPSKGILGLAPDGTDIVFCSDIASLTAMLTMAHTPPTSSALQRLEDLRNTLGLDPKAFKAVLDKVKIQALCTFHVRDTDHQLLVLEVAQSVPKPLVKLLGRQQVLSKASSGGQQFLVYSATAGLAAAAQWSASSHLTPALSEATETLLGHRYWAVVELTDAARRQLMPKGTTNTYAELQQLRQIRFTGEIAGPDDLTVELSGHYDTVDEATKLGPSLGTWLPFTQPPEAMTEGSSTRFVLHRVTFQQFDAFLSKF